MIFNEPHLLELAESNKEAYQQAAPFPHIVLDSIANSQALEKVLEEFPDPDRFEFYKYDNPLEKKLAMDQLSKLPRSISEVLLAMNSPVFLNFLEVLTGIDGLIPDPYYRGGGIHQIVKGGKLDVHIDFNKHTKLKLHRRLNVLIYLNKNWQEEYGGHFELWSGHEENGKHVLEECKVKVLPLFNRLALFSTSEKSYHGHPNELTCPDGRSRKSLATYYYTAEREDEFADTPAHSTKFIKRPEDPEDAEIEALRHKRNQGRLSSNVTGNTVAK